AHQADHRQEAAARHAPDWLGRPGLLHRRGGHVRSHDVRVPWALSVPRRTGRPERSYPLPEASSGPEAWRGTASVIGMVLAAGQGSRLRPDTDTLPKALLPVDGDITILDIALRNLAAIGST